MSLSEKIADKLSKAQSAADSNHLNGSEDTFEAGEAAAYQDCLEMAQREENAPASDHDDAHGSGSFIVNTKQISLKDFAEKYGMSSVTGKEGAWFVKVLLRVGLCSYYKLASDWNESLVVGLSSSGRVSFSHELSEINLTLGLFYEMIMSKDLVAR